MLHDLPGKCKVYAYDVVSSKGRINKTAFLTEEDSGNADSKRHEQNNRTLGIPPAPCDQVICHYPSLSFSRCKVRTAPNRQQSG